MLQDSVRCEAFRRAIREVVTPDSVVLDIGAGTGILSIFAAQAGAKKVYAVEQTQIAKLAKRLVEANGFVDTITVIQSDIAAVELPEKVDIVVSEWLGGYGVDENLLPVVVQARDRWLKPDGKMMPESVTAWMAPAYDELLQQDVDFWRSEPYGIDMGLISQITASQLDCACNHVKEKHIISVPQLMWGIDSMTYSLEDANQPFGCQLDFVAKRGGQFNSLVAWFRAPLSNNVVLCNGPGAPDTHWGRTVFPVGKVISVKTGTRISVKFDLIPQGKGHSNAMWAIEVGDYSFNSEGATLLTEQGATE